MVELIKDVLSRFLKIKENELFKELKISIELIGDKTLKKTDIKALEKLISGPAFQKIQQETNLDKLTQIWNKFFINISTTGTTIIKKVFDRIKNTAFMP